MKSWWKCWQNKQEDSYVCTHMSKTRQTLCAPSSHKSLKKTLNKLKTAQMSFWENDEGCKCLPGFRGSQMEMKIKCHHWAVRPKLTVSHPQIYFPNPGKALCKALRDVHLASCFQKTAQKTATWKCYTFIRDYFRPQNMVILPLRLAIMAF